MTKAAAAIMREPVAQQPAPAQLRPGWVHQLVVAVLAASDEPLTPKQVIHRAESVHGRRLAPSSIRNCLRDAANRPDGAIVRLAYGKYIHRR